MPSEITIPITSVELPTSVLEHLEFLKKIEQESVQWINESLGIPPERVGRDLIRPYTEQSYLTYFKRYPFYINSF